MKIVSKQFCAFIYVILLLSACSDTNDDETVIEGSGNIAVTMSVVFAEGPFDAIMVEYRDAGRIKRTETMSTASWSKSIKVSRGFDIFFMVTGPIEGGGKVDIDVAAKENDENIFSFNRTEDSEVSFDLNLTIEKEL